MRQKIKVGKTYYMHSKRCVVVRFKIRNLLNPDKVVIYYHKGYDRRKLWAYSLEHFANEATEIKVQRKA